MGHSVGRIAAAAIVFAGVLVPTSVLAGTEGRRASPVEIIFVDVGEGDAVVIRAGGKVILSDAGGLHAEKVDAALRATGARWIDVALLSHPHADQIKNLVTLVDDYGWPVSRAVLARSNWWKKTHTNLQVVTLLEERKVHIRYAVAGDRFSWGGASWSILNPVFDEAIGTTDVSNSSVSFVLRAHGVSALFTGDIEPHAARKLAGRWRRARLGIVDIFLATHGGSAYGSTAELLEAVRPRWTILSTGPNLFGHPAPVTVARLESVGSAIWCTHVNGTVTARIEPNGRLGWRTTRQRTPWVSRSGVRTGKCAGR